MQSRTRYCPYCGTEVDVTEGVPVFPASRTHNYDTGRTEVRILPAKLCHPKCTEWYVAHLSKYGKFGGRMEVTHANQ